MLKHKKVATLIALMPLIAVSLYWTLFCKPLDLFNRVLKNKHIYQYNDAHLCKRRLRVLYQSFVTYTLDSDGHLPVVTGRRDWVLPVNDTCYLVHGYSSDHRRPDLEKQWYECPVSGRYLFNLSLSGKELRPLENLEEETIILECPEYMHGGIKYGVDTNGFTHRLRRDGKEANEN